MSTAAPAAKSVQEALNEVTEDDILDDDTEEETEAKAEPEADDEAEEVEEEAEDKPRGDVEGDEQEEGAVEEDAEEENDPIDTLTSDELASIKADPGLNKLRKSLMRGYTQKTQEHAQLVQLGQAYRRDPQGVLKAIADSLGMTVTQAQAAATAASPAAKDPGVELEELFGPQIGPKVRAVFDKWAEARIGGAVKPVADSLGRVVNQSEQARMYTEEVQFKARHKELTPQIEAEVVALGKSGKIVPGDMTPAEYLDTLLDVVMARRARVSAKGATRQASSKLAARIEQNRKDREPKGSSGRGGTIKPVSKIPQARSISEALDFAMKELEEEQ